jgi:26S proteasome regulatory subunit N13
MVWTPASEFRKRKLTRLVDLMHFCWRPRSASVRDPEQELFMINGDASFLPYTGKEKLVSGEHPESPTNGRICVLKFHSSGDRHLYWLQSKSQHPEGKVNWFSQRDLKMLKIIDLYLAGQVPSAADLEGDITFDQSRRDDDDEDEPMDDADAPDQSNSTGGAGADATGGDIREEGEEAREGGADGARA